MIRHRIVCGLLAVGLGTLLIMGRVSAQQAYIGGPPDTWDMQALTNALADLSPDLIPDLDGFIDMLYDYADESYVPRNVDGLSFKRVPMINEVVISNSMMRLQNPGTNDSVVLRVHIAIETWYPFDEDLQMPEFTVHTTEPELLVGPTGYGALNDIALTETVPDPAGSHVAHDFRVTRFTFESSTHTDSWPFVLMLQIIPADMEVRLPNGQSVDRVPGTWPPTAFQSMIPVPHLPYDTPQGVGNALAYSVDDPRLNWNTADFSITDGHWRPMTQTLGAMNTSVGERVGSVPEAVGNMFCAQRALISVAEVTNLLYHADAHWQPVRLFAPDPNDTARIIDRLTVNPDSMGTPYSWLIGQGYTNDLDTAEFEIGDNEHELWESYTAGLIPDDPESRLQLLAFQPPDRVVFQSMEGRLYSILFTPSLTNPDWQHAVTHYIPGTGDILHIPLDLIHPGGSYRLIVHKP